MKSRIFVQQHKENFQKSLLYYIADSRQHAENLTIVIATVFGFRVFLTDVIQPYLQSAEARNRDIFINSEEEFNVKLDALIKLLKALNVLAERGDYWGRTLRYYFEKHLGV